MIFEVGLVMGNSSSGKVGIVGLCGKADTDRIHGIRWLLVDDIENSGFSAIVNELGPRATHKCNLDNCIKIYLDLRVGVV